MPPKSSKERNEAEILKAGKTLQPVSPLLDTGVPWVTGRELTQYELAWLARNGYDAAPCLYLQNGWRVAKT